MTHTGSSAFADDDVGNGKAFDPIGFNAKWAPPRAAAFAYYQPNAGNIRA
jgi:hypothetical protein